MDKVHADHFITPACLLIKEEAYLIPKNPGRIKAA
jgi:hypothetical protein